jgi:hypothetical protein
LSDQELELELEFGLEVIEAELIGFESDQDPGIMFMFTS